MTEILTSEIEEAMQRLAGLEPDPAKRAQIIDAATTCSAMGGYAFLDLVDVLGKIVAKASRGDVRLIAHALSYYAAVRDDSIRRGLAVGEKIDAPHNVQAARDRDRAIELSGRFR